MSPVDNQSDNVAEFPRQETIQAQASAWIARLDGHKLSRQEHAEFQQWVNRSPRHREEIRRLCALWDDLNILTELAAPPATAHRQAKARRAGRSRMGTALAFGVLLAAIAVSLTFLAPWEAPEPTVFHAAEIGAQKTVELEDGSVMQLNTGSHAKVEYSQDIRRIRLLKGEAYFEVAHDPERPFLVHAGNNVVRAVGTAFSVHIEQSDLEVLVTEGVVELTLEAIGSSTNDTSTAGIANAGGLNGEKGYGSEVERNTEAGGRSAPTPTITISAGQSIKAGKEKSPQLVTEQQIRRELAWRQKMLAFSDTPLSEVISEVNRYTATTIVISDPGLGQLRIGGYFRTGETEALLGALESSFGVRVVRVNDKLVYLALAE